MKVVWVINWEDLSSAWSTKEKALEFLRGEMERINATMTITEECDYFFWVAVQYVDGSIEHFYCTQYEVDELPYV